MVMESIIGSHRERNTLYCTRPGAFVGGSLQVGKVLIGAFFCALSTAVSCVGEDGEEPVSWPDVAVDPTPVVLKRLTKAQYSNSILDLVGEDIAVPISLEPDAAVDGFLVVGGSKSSISALGVERYETAAHDIAEQAMSSSSIREALVPCVPAGDSDASCSEAFVQSFGRRAFRRPLTDEETTRYVGVAVEAANKLGDFHQGLAFAMAGLLQSPHFLFRIELGESADGRLAYTDYEMATRLSYFLWNTTPDDELLDAAEAGSLADEAGLAKQVDRMLASPKAREGLRNFFYERFALHELDDLVKDGDIFTSMSAELGPAAREETLSAVEDLVFDRDADYRTIFTSRKTFVDRRLASLYDVPAPDLEQFAATMLPADGPRAGLLGHASVLALHAHSTSTSATLRGKFIRVVLLCMVIPPPPADVDTSLPEANETFPTLRDRIAQHNNDPACASCHSVLDPIGLGLEQFDGIGQFRLDENDATIDPSGDLDGVTFAGAVQLGEAIAQHDEVGRCLTRHLYRYAIGTTETKAEAALLDQLGEQFEHDGHRIKALMRRIALSDGFRFAQEAP